MKLKLNKDMAGYKAGRTINISTDINNVPVDIFWRKRLKDSKIDNCVEVIKTSKPKQEKKINGNHD